MQNKSPPNHPVIHTPATCLSPTSHLLLLPSIQGNYPTILTSASFYFLYIDCRLVALDSSRSFSTCAFGSTFARLRSTTADLRATYIVPYYYLPTPFTWETRKKRNKTEDTNWRLTGFLISCNLSRFFGDYFIRFIYSPSPKAFPEKAFLFIPFILFQLSKMPDVSIWFLVYLLILCSGLSWELC